MSQPNASPVQTVQRNTWTTGTTFTFTISAPTNGNMGIIVFAFNGTSITVSGISQTGCTWLSAAADHTNKDCEIWYCFNYSGGGTTITLTMSGAPANDLVLDAIFLEWADSGGSTSGYTKDAGSGTNSGTTNANTGTKTPTASVNALAIAGFKSNGAFSAGPTNSFTEIAASTSQPGNFRADYRVITPTSGGYSTDYTSAGTWNAALAFFTAPTGAAPKNLPAGFFQQGVL